MLNVYTCSLTPTGVRYFTTHLHVLEERGHASMVSEQLQIDHHRQSTSLAQGQPFSCPQLAALTLFQVMTKRTRGAFVSLLKDHGHLPNANLRTLQSSSSATIDNKPSGHGSELWALLASPPVATF